MIEAPIMLNTAIKIIALDKRCAVRIFFKLTLRQIKTVLYDREITTVELDYAKL